MTEESFRIQFPSWALIFIFLCLNHGVVSTDATYWLNPPDRRFNQSWQGINHVQNVTTWVVGETQTISWDRIGSIVSVYNIYLVQEMVNNVYQINVSDPSHVIGIIPYFYLCYRELS